MTSVNNRPVIGSAPFAWSNYFSVNYISRLLYTNTLNTDPVEETTKFLSQFYGNYGSTHPNFRNSSYNEAVQFAKSQFKMLIIYVHSENHPDAQSFCRDILFTDQFSNYVEENFVIWACDVSGSNGLKISNSLEATTYPYIALLCCNSIPGLSSGSSVLRLEAFQGTAINSDTIVNLLTNAASTYEPSLIAAKADHDLREQDRLIRMEQDEAYELSLLADQEKERKAQEAERERLKEEERLRLEEEERVNYQNELIRKKEAKKQLFLIEPRSGADTTSLAIRLVDGSRVQRIFLQTDTIQTILDYIDSTIDEPIENFVLSTNYPKKQLTILSQNLKDAGLVPNGAVFLSEK